MNDDGTLNAAAGPYAGLDRFEARKTLWADMASKGLVIKEEPHTLRVPRSQRGGEVVEPLVREQWFVKMTPLAEPALEVRFLDFFFFLFFLEIFLYHTLVFLNLYQYTGYAVVYKKNSL
jgi:valyl-tRNA synthetase